ncbi:MAG: hypothetical protein O7C98_01735 [Planctomycetota bacterium]|nr:hypothetical protein [Planctomycetota bacterium]
MEETILKFTSNEVTIELQGSEDFVERQIQFFRRHLQEARVAGAETATALPSGAEGTPSLADFYKSRRTRRGRGAIQEALLLFGFYMQAVEGNVEFSIEQVGGCFGVVGLDLPKNLHHAVGTLKRKHGWFEEGSKRGRYRVSSEGLKLVRPL